MKRATVGLWLLLFVWGCSGARASDECELRCELGATPEASAEASADGSSSSPPGEPGPLREGETTVESEPAVPSNDPNGEGAAPQGSGSSVADAGNAHSAPDVDEVSDTSVDGSAAMAGSTDAGDPVTGDAPVPTDDGEPSAGPSSSRLTQRPIGTTDAGLGYWEYLPPNYGSEPAPLLVFTHGAAWQGEGTEQTLQELLEVGPPNLISTDAWPNDRPFIVLSPQNPRAGCFEADDIDAFYRYAVEAYAVDRSRIYHTGQSCGAIGAWNYLADHLDEFVTAAVLIAGNGADAFARAGCDLGRVAIWGLHNEGDATVPARGTSEPITGLLACEPTPDAELTIFPGETAHDAWTKTYDLSAGHDIYAWLLEHIHP